MKLTEDVSVKTFFRPGRLFITKHLLLLSSSKIRHSRNDVWITTGNILMCVDFSMDYKRKVVNLQFLHEKKLVYKEFLIIDWNLKKFERLMIGLSD